MLRAVTGAVCVTSYKSLHDEFGVRDELKSTELFEGHGATMGDSVARRDKDGTGLKGLDLVGMGLHGGPGTPGSIES